MSGNRTRNEVNNKSARRRGHRASVGHRSRGFATSSKRGIGLWRATHLVGGYGKERNDPGIPTAGASEIAEIEMRNSIGHGEEFDRFAGSIVARCGDLVAKKPADGTA